MNYAYASQFNTPAMMNALRESSVSNEDARIRGEQYQKTFARNEELRWEMANSPMFRQKMFSGYAETPLGSTQYFNASVASFVSSFAGFLSIERDLDQPTGLLYWFDVLGVSELDNIIPNLGPDAYQNIPSLAKIETPLTVTATASYSVALAKKVIPGSLRVKIKKFDGASTVDTFELIDNGQGQLMSVAGKLKSSKVSYINGRVEFELDSAMNGDPAKESIVVLAKEDSTGTPTGTRDGSGLHINNRRFMTKQQEVRINTAPDLLIGEYNIASLSAMKKATGSDMATFLFNKLREIYTKVINYNLVATLEESYQGDVMSGLDMSEGASNFISTFHTYSSRPELFDAYLVEVENSLAARAVKGCNTTAYLVGANAANQFMKAGQINKFKRNTKTTYINDLIGWYDGIPVLRSTDVKESTGEGTFYAIHKTADGQMAPLARGIYMPLTDTPTVGNYNNPTQLAAGVYYQEGIRSIAPQLVQKVTFKMGF